MKWYYLAIVLIFSPNFIKGYTVTINNLTHDKIHYKIEYYACKSDEGNIEPSTDVPPSGNTKEISIVITKQNGQKVERRWGFAQYCKDATFLVNESNIWHKQKREIYTYK
jgi:hypothetical protein